MNSAPIPACPGDGRNAATGRRSDLYRSPGLGRVVGVYRSLGALLGMVLAGCTGAFDLDGPRSTGPAPLNFPECAAQSYDFVGEGTLAALGLDDATPVPPPEPNRVAMIWVTHDLLPRDFGEPGGPVEMVRMLCFEFADGSGGSGWPVDPAWQPPASDLAAVAQGEDPGLAVPQALLLVALAAALVIGLSIFAFRGRR